MKKTVLALILSVVLLVSCMPAFAEAAIPDDPATIPAGLEIDWTTQYTYPEMEAQFAAMAETYPDITNLYAFGRTWQERQMWCLEITNEAIDAAEKTGIAVLGPIHGNEHEAAVCSMYFAWWTLLNSDTEYVQNLLNNYIFYVSPTINPDGYEEFNRENLRPHNANGITIYDPETWAEKAIFTDPGMDIDGDGFVATLLRGTADVQPEYSWDTVAFGLESLDADGNNILGDDPMNSGVDMNRTFDYMFARTEDLPATDPEVKAIEWLLSHKNINALVALHTGEQSVLYPWCYRDWNDADQNTDLAQMDDIAKAMAEAFQTRTGRGFYALNSYSDYPTNAELIDYAYGRFNIHAYTIEVYTPGKSEDGAIENCYWEDELPEPIWKFYDQAALSEMGIIVETLIGADNGEPLAENEGLWFYVSPRTQNENVGPEEQDLLVKGCRDAILTMVESEPYGVGYTKPVWMD